MRFHHIVRPITLLSCLGKLFERILQRRLEYQVENNQILQNNQHGFRKKQGTVDILLKLENIIRYSLGNRHITLVIYVDLKSAFDTVWPEGLITKLIGNGFKGPLLGLL